MSEDTITRLAHTFKATFDQFYDAPLAVWKEFAAQGCIEEFQKNDVLKTEHTKENYFYFMLEGSAGVFVWKENNWACLDFAFQGHFFGDYMSIITGQATPLQTMVLEKSLLFKMKRSAYIELGQTEFGSVLTKFAAEFSYLSKQQQQIDLLTKTAEQRYLELLSREPQIIHKVAQKHLASFLGITPQSFSRIRKSIAEQDQILP